MPAPLLAGVSMAVPAAAGGTASAGGASFLGPLLAAIGAGGAGMDGKMGLMDMLQKKMNPKQQQQDPYAALSGLGAGGFPINSNPVYIGQTPQIEYAPSQPPMANFFRNLGRGQ